MFNMKERLREYAYILTFTGKEKRRKEIGYDHPSSETINKINEEALLCF